MRQLQCGREREEEHPLHWHPSLTARLLISGLLAFTTPATDDDDDEDDGYSAGC